jgi:hypothetical protein
MMTQARLRLLLHKVAGSQDFDLNERRFLVKLLDTQIKKPDPRLSKSAAKRKRVAMTALNYQSEHDCSLEAGIQQAMTVHQVGRKYVFDAIAELRGSPIATETWCVAGTVRRFVMGRDRQWRELDSV